nr:kinesin-like protein KIN-4A [Ipomoea batatas]
MESSDYPMTENETLAGDLGDMDEEAAKEWEHTLLQDSMGKELNELNRRLEQKESEMKLYGGFDTTALKHHFGKKILELEEEKRAVQVVLKL